MEAQPEAQAEATQAEALQGKTQADVTQAETQAVTHAPPPEVSGGANSSSEVVGSAAAFVESAASFVESTARAQQGVPLSDHEQHIEHLVRGPPPRAFHARPPLSPNRVPTCYPRAISRETEPLRDPPPTPQPRRCSCSRTPSGCVRRSTSC